MPKISQDEIIALQKALKTDAAIGKKIGLTAQRVQQIREEYGIPAIRMRDIKKKIKIIALYKMGTSTTDIAKIFGFSESMIRMIIECADGNTETPEKGPASGKNRKFGCLQGCRVY